jgi:hypothetical protein
MKNTSIPACEKEITSAIISTLLSNKNSSSLPFSQPYSKHHQHRTEARASFIQMR